MSGLEDQLQAASRALEVADAGPVVRLIAADSITPQPINWLWPGWIARGKLHVLAGPPGVGKTTVAVNLAALVSAGWTFPDGAQAAPGHVLIWSGEDDPGDTLVPRLAVNGADLSRVHFVGSRTDGTPFDPAWDMPALQAAVDQLPEPPVLLLLDPLVSAVAGDSHKNAEVRRSLQPVADLAGAIGCAVLGITHFSKGTAGRDPVERVSGSIAFGAVARIVMGAAKLPDDHADGPGRILVRAKSNLGEDTGGFRYELEQSPMPGNPLILASRVSWLGAVAGQARDILATAEVYRDPEEQSAVTEAGEWLRESLRSGPLSGATLQDLARKAGISRATLYRAKPAVGVITESGGFGKARIWSLPSVPTVATRSNPENLETHGGLETHGAASGNQRPGSWTDPMCLSRLTLNATGANGIAGHAAAYVREAI
ncbi:MAG: AAA family ATPase [Gammaproteobacteria bacterium]